MNNPKTAIQESAKYIEVLSNEILVNSLDSRDDALKLESVMIALEAESAKIRRQLRLAKANLFALKQGESKQTLSV